MDDCRESERDMRRSGIMACLAMIVGLDSFELEDVLREAGLDPDTCTPEEAAKALKQRGYVARDLRSWPFAS